MSFPDHCPCCGREFKGVLDYPRVRILHFERLPLPEAIDSISAAAADKQLARWRERRSDPDAAPGLRQEGINMTPLISQACERGEIQDYFARLAVLAGHEVDPRELLPPLAPHGRFKWAHPLPDAGLYLSLRESEVSDGPHPGPLPEGEGAGGRAADVEVYCDGPNMGSAGGPTLQSLGAVARLRYEGLLKA